MFVIGKATRVILFANGGGGLRPPQPPRFLKAMDACKRKQESGRRQHRCSHQKTSIRSSPCGSFMFAVGESYAGHLVCKWGGGCAPPQPPRFLKAMDASKRKQESGRRQHRCLQKTSVRSSPCRSFMFVIGKATKVILFAIGGGGCAPPNPPLFKGHGCLQKKTRVRSSPPSMFAPKNKHQVVAMWIIHFCTRGKLRGSFCLPAAS